MNYHDYSTAITPILAEAEANFRRALGATTVLCHGCFDVLHLGHIKHLQEAKSLGDRLVVSVTDDSLVNKGPGRPRFSASERMEMLRSLECVDEVILSRSINAVDVINTVRPAVFVKGGDYADSREPNLMQEKAAVEALGGRIHFTAPTPWHSSDLLKTRSDEVSDYLARAKRFLPEIREALEKARSLKTLFVGEHIIDEYRYVRTLGKSSKEPLVATVSQGVEQFEGGVMAAYKHGEAVSPLSYVGRHGFSLRKTRYVSTDYNRKLFEVYSSERIDGLNRERFHNDLAADVECASLVVVLDFGHGLIDNETRAILSQAKFLAVNAQSNAANHGFNPVTKYNKADYVCVDEPEARLATRMKHEPIEDVMDALGLAIDCQHFVVTHGQHGTNTLRFANAYRGQMRSAARVPVFSDAAVVDTMGAGDAFLAVTAPLVAVGLDLEAAAIVGNVAGAIKCGIVGHRRAVQRDELVRGVEDLLS